MANSQSDSNQIDRLSNLPDTLLVTIISFLPTHFAARTSVLCRRFSRLWETSPSLALISKDLPLHSSAEKFVAMSERAFLCRNPSLPLLSLRLEVSHCYQIISFIASLLEKARSLHLRHRTIEGCWSSGFLTILPIIFTIKSLRCLSLDGFNDAPNFPSGITLTCLRSLSIISYLADTVELNSLLYELCSLEDLHLHLRALPGISLSSQTIRKLKLIIAFSTRKLDILRLSIPSLESLHLEIKESLQCLSHIYGEVPLLRKAVINLYKLHERDITLVAGLLNCISHVEELSLHINESPDEKYPIPILLKLGKNVPEFLMLEHLGLTLCFHEHNLEAVTTMLRHNCPALKSLKLVHKVPKFTGLARGRKRKDWGSKLPRNADGNYRYACFSNLHLEENRKEVIKLLRKKCSSKRQARN